MNKFCKSSLLSLLIAAAALPSAALAHRTFLIASSGHVDGKEPWVTFDAAVGEDLFDFGANAVKLDGLSITGPDGKSLSPENPFTGKLRSSFDLKLAQEGTYRVAIVNESVMGSYKIGNEIKRVRGGTAESFAKEVPAGATEVRTTTTVGRLETFVTSGKGNDTVFKPTNVGLEILPLTHPSDFLPGQPARFKLLLDGKPLADQTISVVPGGVRFRGVLNEQTAKTDAKGEFSVKWNFAALYALMTSYPPRAAGGPQGAGPGAAPQQPPQPPAKRYTYTGTFEVLPE